MRRPSLLGILAPLAIIAGAVILNQSTDGRFFTAFPDPDLARMQSYEASDPDVFRDPVLDAQRPPPPVIDNAFHFGWLPSGLSRNALSVLVVALLALPIPLLFPKRPPDKPAPPASSNSNT